MWSAFFVLSILPEIWRISFRFRQFCFYLTKLKSQVILKAQKTQTTFWKWQDKGNFVIIFSRNLLQKLDWQINAANYIKNQDDIQVVLHTVMFCGTPCILLQKSVKIMLIDSLQYLNKYGQRVKTRKLG